MPPSLRADEEHILYVDNHAWLHAWLRRKLGCAFEAADLAHDTYVRLLASRRLPAPQDSRAYLMQIAKGLVVDLRRHRRIEAAYRESLMLLPEAHWPSAEARAALLETLVEIDAMLDAMPPKVRQTFVLSRFDGLTYTQIADRLRVSVPSVRKYMLKAAQACLTIMAA
ncbi:sigma-70 family RNA polymerase sigma factor [Chitinasiproducens palmae]|uniref:RNA polymerase sigma-70 factor, ECF subfamily n=1 Tax=Chitinasiproducens palmae TaxID=1770053 RepID=A0A1H2PJ03_9BURK|nr:sigma-70 family RNA polymerase sigma factor [Chitinasiproducens palmae]SDV46245.1 RNA polymerase sigma-70 factor, ECF subfamily [Chitinasiproducens palmae]